MTFAGREFELQMGSDVQRDGMFLELNELRHGERVVVAEMFYSDEDGRLELTEYEPGCPPSAIAWLRAEGARRLPPVR